MRLKHILGALGVAALLTSVAPAAQAQDMRHHGMRHHDRMMMRHDRMMMRHDRMMHRQHRMMGHHRMMRHMRDHRM